MTVGQSLTELSTDFSFPTYQKGILSPVDVFILWHRDCVRVKETRDQMAWSYLEERRRKNARSDRRSGLETSRSHLQVSFSCPSCSQGDAAVLTVVEQVGDREAMPHAP